MSYTSGDTADADAFEAAIRGARTRAALAPITLTGDQRQFMVDQLTAAREALLRAAGDTKVRYEQARYRTAADGTHTALGLIAPVEAA